MKSSAYTVVVAGVGGLGVMRLSRIIASAAHSAFPFVCRTESRGLSQRGGPALSAVRFGPLPLVASLGTGCEDLYLSLDALETLRLLPAKRQDATCLTNTEFLPTADLSGDDERSLTLKATITSRFRLHHCFSIDLGKAVESAACPGCQNMVMLGAASHFLPVSTECLLREAIAQIPGRDSLIERAFNAGREALRPEVSSPTLGGPT